LFGITKDVTSGIFFKEFDTTAGSFSPQLWIVSEENSTSSLQINVGVVFPKNVSNPVPENITRK
jgi:hypothetical protein